MIRLNGIHKYYNKNKNNEVHALNDFSLEIKKGELVAIMGASGSGKSTLLNLIGCIDTATTGTYLLDGIDVSALNDERRAEIRCQKIGFVLQDFATLDDETALENVKVPLYFDKRFRIGKLNKTAKKALDKVMIGDLSKRKVGQMSGGKKQRVAIARAIVNDPSIILADEPTGALDSTTSKQIIELFKDLNSLGTTVLIVTHDEDIANHCHRIIRIEDGKLVSSEERLA